MRETLYCIAAIYRRDLLLAATHPFAFIMRAFGIAVGITGVYFFAQIVDPRHFAKLSESSSGYFGYVSINIAFTMLQGSALLSFAQAARTDQTIGSLEPILATQTRAASYVIACGFWPLTLTALEVTLGLSVAWALGLRLHSVDYPALLLFMFLSTATMASVGILSVAAVIAFKQLPPSGYLIGGAAPLLAGTFFPVSLLPWQLGILSWLLPLTHALRGLRGSVTGVPISRLSGDALWLAVTTLVLLPFSFYVLEFCTHRAKRDGTLSQY